MMFSRNHDHEISFYLDLPQRPDPIELYPNLSSLSSSIIDNMNDFQTTLKHLTPETEPVELVDLVDELTSSFKNTLNLSSQLQQHLSLLTDSDEEIHIPEPVINYIQAILNHTNRMNDIVVAAQTFFTPAPRQNR